MCGGGFHHWAGSTFPGDPALRASAGGRAVGTVQLRPPTCGPSFTADIEVDRQKSFQLLPSQRTSETWRGRLPDRKQKPTRRVVSPEGLSRACCRGRRGYREQAPGNGFLRLSAILGLHMALASGCPRCPVRRCLGLLASLLLQVQFAAEAWLVPLAWPVFSTCVVLANFRHQQSPFHRVINLTEGKNAQPTTHTVEVHRFVLDGREGKES